MKRIAVIVSLVVLLTGCNEDPVRTFDEQLAIDIEAIDTYIADNNIQNVQEDPSGIRYIVEELGTGLVPEVNWIVKVDYTGYFLTDPDPDGTPFDQGQGVEFVLSQVIAGWQIMLSQFGEGTTLKVYIPSGYAYGFAGRPRSIPSNANLIFEITLISARK